MNSFQQQQTAIKGALSLPELPGQPLFSLFVDLLLLSPLSCHYLITPCLIRVAHCDLNAPVNVSQ